MVPKEEKDEEAASAAPMGAEGQDQKPPVAAELAVDVGQRDEPGEAAPAEPVKTEGKEEAAEEGPDKVKGAAEAEPTPEGALKVDKKEGGAGPSGKAPPAKGSGTPQDSDSSATCSADEVDEPEGGDKSRCVHVCLLSLHTQTEPRCMHRSSAQRRGRLSCPRGARPPCGQGGDAEQSSGSGEAVEGTAPHFLPLLCLGCLSLPALGTLDFNHCQHKRGDPEPPARSSSSARVGAEGQRCESRSAPVWRLASS